MLDDSRSIVLRAAAEPDLRAVVELERRPDNERFIVAWPPKRHAASLVDADLRYLMVEADHMVVGFVLVAGLAPIDRGRIELRRIVVGKKGAGIGQQAIQRLLAWAFAIEAVELVWVDMFAEVRLHASRLVILAAVFPGLATARDAITALRDRAPWTAIVVTELPGPHLSPLAAFKAGATGYVLKDETMDRWFPAMLRLYVRTGVPPVSTEVSDEVLKELPGSLAFGPMAGDPSDRELEVLALVGKGLTNLQIASGLGIRSSTVKSHVHSLLAKLALTNRVQLALYGRRNHRDG
jgi:DNA-binding NarL/FixJ family response regulator